MSDKQLLVLWLCLLMLKAVCSNTSLKSKDDHAHATLWFSMEDCVDYALKHSRSYGREQLEVLSSKLEVETQRLALDPSLTFNNNQNLEDQSLRNNSVQLSKDWHGGWNTRLSARKSSSSGHDDTLSRSVRLSKELLKGGWSLETRVALDNSLVDLLVRTNILQKQRRELVFQVRSKYYEVLRNLETLNIRKLNLLRSEKNLENAIEREEPMDIATARLEVPSSELAVLNSEMSIAKSVDELKLLIGLDVERDLKVTPDWKFGYLAIDWAVDRKWSIDNHEDFINAGLNIDKQTRLIQIAKKKRWPRLTLSGDFTEKTTAGLDERDASVSLGMNWKIGSRLERVAVRSAELNLEKLELRLRDSKQRKLQVLREFERRFEAQERSIQLNERELALRQLQVDLFLDRWNEGEIDILELVRNQNILQNSKVNLVNTKVKYLELIEAYHFNVGRIRD